MNDDVNEAAGAGRERGCPICGKPPIEQYRPFCSRRCADVDLNRWLTGAYAIPVTEDDDEDGETPTLAPEPPRGS